MVAKSYKGETQEFECDEGHTVEAPSDEFRAMYDDPEVSYCPECEELFRL